MAMNSNQAVIGIEAKVYFNPYQEVTVINGYIHKHCFMPDGRRSQVSYYPVPIGDQTFYTCDLNHSMSRNCVGCQALSLPIFKIFSQGISPRPKPLPRLKHKNFSLPYCQYSGNGV